MHRMLPLAYVAVVPLLLCPTVDVMEDVFFYLTWFMALFMMYETTTASKSIAEMELEAEIDVEARVASTTATSEGGDEGEIALTRCVTALLLLTCLVIVSVCALVERYDVAFATVFLFMYRMSEDVFHTDTATMCAAFFVAAIYVPSSTTYLRAFVALFGFYTLELN